MYCEEIAKSRDGGIGTMTAGKPMLDVAYLVSLMRMDCFQSKLRRYEAFIATSNRGKLVPIPISILGGWHQDAYTFLFGITRNVAVRAIESYGNIWATITQRHAVVAVMSNAACLIAGLQQVI